MVLRVLEVLEVSSVLRLSGVPGCTEDTRGTTGYWALGTGEEELGTKSTGVFENTGGTSDTVVTGRWTERQQEGRGTTFTPYYVSLQLF